MTIKVNSLPLVTFKETKKAFYLTYQTRIYILFTPKKAARRQTKSEKSPMYCCCLKEYTKEVQKYDQCVCNV